MVQILCSTIRNKLLTVQKQQTQFWPTSSFRSWSKCTVKRLKSVKDTHPFLYLFLFNIYTCTISTGKWGIHVYLVHLNKILFFSLCVLRLILTPGCGNKFIFFFRTLLTCVFIFTDLDTVTLGQIVLVGYNSKLHVY